MPPRPSRPHHDTARGLPALICIEYAIMACIGLVLAIHLVGTVKSYTAAPAATIANDLPA
jgi:hypothetical protein